ncbi:signal transduction histidine kinase [Azospirillum fermentarium]|uniref:sensor histidine kinase n=1 Tax=Azospirillum fermentarium TaxID=1233114 RepID=UPI002226AC8B|nr:HAMP domain-containing sensor histidine kinase [Azospirillum fermentarium]MCW2249446.1 signal transduction histidine kinase [Azospirillum fermentarium]
MKELLATLFLMSIVNAGIAGLIWNAYRHLQGVRLIAVGFIVGAVAVMVGGAFYRPAPGFLNGMTGYLPNILVYTSLALCVNGVMIFLGKTPRRWLLPFSILFPMIYWPLALATDPGDGAFRSLAGAVVLSVGFGSVVPVVWRRQGDCAWLRWTLLPGIVIHLSLQGTWSLYRVWLRLTGEMDPTMFFPWTIVESGVAHHLWFVCFLAMLGARLQSKVEQRNRDLAHEIDRRRHLEQQLAATLAAERQTHAEYRQLLDIVVHEVRTPLTGIDRAAEMLQLQPTVLPDAGLRRLTEIRAGVRRVAGLVDRITASERTGHVQFQPQPLDLMAVVQTVVGGLGHLGAERRVQVAGPGHPVWLETDPSMIIAILRNLVENALKYSPPPTPVVLSALAHDGMVTVTVTDQGIGIPDLERPSIGRRFYRASNTGRHSGNGLGLFIARRFLAEMAGTMRHDPGPGNLGTCVTLTLPVRPLETDMPEARYA